MRGLELLTGAGVLALATGCEQPEVGSEQEDGAQEAEAEATDPEARAGTLEASDGAEIYFISPEDGETVESPVRVRFGLRGMGVAPAGIDSPDTGHHHLLVDDPDVSLDEPLPDGEGRVLHFGGGQTEAEIDLDEGEHTLRAVLGDWKHEPHDPPVMSEPVTIIVEN